MRGKLFSNSTVHPSVGKCLLAEEIQYLVNVVLAILLLE
jgi:hypothetical protein